MQLHRWVAQAWEAVRPEKIKKCFRKAGILDKKFVVMSHENEEDPFEDLESSHSDSSELEDPVVHTVPAEVARCSADEYINGDGELAICLEQDESWEEQFLTCIGLVPRAESEEPEDQYDLEPPPPKIKSFSEAIRYLEDVQAFLDSRGYANEATEISCRVSTVTYLQYTSASTARQITIHEFLSS